MGVVRGICSEECGCLALFAATMGVLFSTLSADVALRCVLIAVWERSRELLGALMLQATSGQCTPAPTRTTYTAAWLKFTYRLPFVCNLLCGHASGRILMRGGTVVMPLLCMRGRQLFHM